MVILFFLVVSVLLFEKLWNLRIFFWFEFGVFCRVYGICVVVGYVVVLGFL